MADNYLEKQREQYEARKAAWERAKKFGKKKQPIRPHSTGTKNTDAGDSDPEQQK